MCEVTLVHVTAGDKLLGLLGMGISQGYWAWVSARGTGYGYHTARGTGYGYHTARGTGYGYQPGVLGMGISQGYLVWVSYSHAGVLGMGIGYRVQYFYSQCVFFYELLNHYPCKSP